MYHECYRQAWHTVVQWSLESFQFEVTGAVRCKGEVQGWSTVEILLSLNGTDGAGNVRGTIEQTVGAKEIRSELQRGLGVRVEPTDDRCINPPLLMEGAQK